MTITNSIQDLVLEIEKHGGEAILVGGSVRDMVMTMGDPFSPLNDIDIEVFGFPWDKVKEVVGSMFPYGEVGEQFLVLKVDVPGFTLPVDLSIPRRENQTGSGHRDLEVVGDPFMSFGEAAKRRDFTINAMGYDPLNGYVLDPYGGEYDIEQKIIRHVSESFIDDPLRPLRAARFSSRFGFSIALETIEFCRTMRPLADFLPAERIWDELKKTLLQSPNPGFFFCQLHAMGWLDLFPEVDALRGVPQENDWHPEGDVFIHTCHALDYWAKNLKTGEEDDDLLVALAILCHDFGKPSTTEFIDGRIRSRGHEEAGVEPTRHFLKCLRQHALADKVYPMVEHHLAPVTITTPRAMRRLSVSVERIDLLALVSRADQAGRPPKDPAEAFKKIDSFLALLKDVGVEEGKPKNLISGNYLISLGLIPGPHFKKILDEVYEAQLDGLVNTGEEAKLLVKDLMCRESLTKVQI